LYEDENIEKIFSPLFESFVYSRRNELLSEGKEGIRCDLVAGLIYLHGQDITLRFRSKHQRKLLFYLYQHKNQICDKEEIIAAVYGSGVGISDGAYYQLNQRVREKIEIDPHKPQYLHTHPGGLMLQVPEN
jgi:DNA-binding response OmpR family regulator